MSHREKHVWLHTKDDWGRPYTYSTEHKEVRKYEKWVLEEMEFLVDFCEATNVTKVLSACGGWRKNTVHDLTGWDGLKLEDGRITALTIKNKKLSGHLPASISNLSRLNVLNLKHNRLQGMIPKSICQCKHLFWIELSGNNLAGKIPHEIGNLQKLRMLWLNENRLHGNIPYSLMNCKDMHLLFLNHNQLTGEIPIFLGQLPHLEQLCLQHNKLTGDVPEALMQRSIVGEIQLAVQSNLLDTKQLNTKVPLFPFFVMNRSRFQEMTFFPDFELAHGKGWLTEAHTRFTDRSSRIGNDKVWTKHTNIAFFSHRWLKPVGKGKSKPNPDDSRNTKLNQMKDLLEDRQV